MARRWTRKRLKQDEFVEAAFSAEQWIEEHWRTLAKATVAVLLVAAIAAGWLWWRDSRRERAELLLAEGLTAYTPAAGTVAGPEDLSRALALFEESAAAAGGKVGWVADFYRANTLLRLERPDEAIQLLERCQGNAPSVALAGAASMQLAHAYRRTDRPEDAIDVLRGLAGGTGGYAEHALFQLAQLLRDTGRGEEAKQALAELTERFPQGVTAADARRMLERLQS